MFGLCVMFGIACSSAYSFSNHARSRASTVCKAGSEMNNNNFFLPPLIAKKEDNIDHFIKQLCDTMKLNPTYIAPGEISADELKLALDTREPSSLLVIDDSDLVSESVEVLREVTHRNCFLLASC